MKKTISFFLAVLMLAGCGTQSDGNSETEKNSSGNTVTNTSAETDSNSDTNIKDYYEVEMENSDLISFAVDDKGLIYAINQDENMILYTSRGRVKEEFENAKSLSNLYYRDGAVYAFDYSKSAVVSVNSETKEIKEIAKLSDVSSLNNLVSDGENVYTVAVPACNGENCEHDHSASMDENGYMNFNEVIYKTNISTGETEALDISNPIAIYCSQDGKMYVYTYQDKTYELYELDSKNKLKQVSEMNDVGYLFSFVYENGDFIYATPSQQIINLKIKSRESRVEAEGFISGGSNMQYHMGNIVYLESLSAELGSEEFNTKMASVLLNQTSVVINMSALPKSFLNIEKIVEISGTACNINAAPIYTDEMLLKLMAKDSDIDIYTVTTGNLTCDIRRMGAYSALNESEILTDYINNSCFDYVADSVINSNGDIMFLPVNTSGSVVFYSKPSFEKHGITSEDVEYLDGFMEVAERLYEENASEKIYVTPLGPFCSFLFQYEAFYSDPETQSVDYNTELFEHWFTTLLDGFECDSIDNPVHKYFSLWLNSKYTGEDQMTYLECYESDKALMTCATLDLLNSVADDDIANWGAVHEPWISQEVDKNKTSCTYLMINPYSKNKEAAIKVLETIAQNYNETTNGYGFFRKDKNEYAEKFDINSDLFNDIYNIYENGMLYEYSTLLYSSDIQDYQMGKTTFEEFAQERYRQREMWLNE